MLQPFGNVLCCGRALLAAVPTTGTPQLGPPTAAGNLSGPPRVRLHTAPPAHVAASFRVPDLFSSGYFPPWLLYYPPQRPPGLLHAGNAPYDPQAAASTTADRRPGPRLLTLGIPPRQTQPTPTRTTRPPYARPDTQLCSPLHKALCWLPGAAHRSAPPPAVTPLRPPTHLLASQASASCTTTTSAMPRTSSAPWTGGSFLKVIEEWGAFPGRCGV